MPTVALELNKNNTFTMTLTRDGKPPHVLTASNDDWHLALNTMVIYHGIAANDHVSVVLQHKVGDEIKAQASMFVLASRDFQGRLVADRSAPFAVREDAVLAGIAPVYQEKGQWKLLPSADLNDLPAALAAPKKAVAISLPAHPDAPMGSDVEIALTNQAVMDALREHGQRLGNTEHGLLIDLGGERPHVRLPSNLESERHRWCPHVQAEDMRLLPATEYKSPDFDARFNQHVGRFRFGGSYEVAQFERQMDTWDPTPELPSNTRSSINIVAHLSDAQAKGLFAQQKYNRVHAFANMLGDSFDERKTKLISKMVGADGPFGHIEPGYINRQEWAHAFLVASGQNYHDSKDLAFDLSRAATGINVKETPVRFIETLSSAVERLRPALEKATEQNPEVAIRTGLRP